MDPYCRKYRISFQHLVLRNYCGRRLRVGPCPVCGVLKLHPVECLLEGMRQTGQEGEQHLDDLRDVEGGLQEEVGAVW